MKKVITVTISVDEEEIKNISKKDELEHAITMQLDQLNKCGMHVDYWQFKESPYADITVVMDIGDRHKIFGAHQLLTMETVKENDIKASVAAILKNRNGMNINNMVFTDDTEREIIVSISVSKEDLSWDTGRLFGKKAINDAFEWMAEECEIDFDWYWSGMEPFGIRQCIEEHREYTNNH